MAKIRILFYTDDFKTDHWGRELEKNGCEIVPNAKEKLKYFSNILRHARIILKQLYKGKRVHVFVFRYLNDNKHLRVSLEYLIRDVLTVILCKLTNIKILWILHNINKETIVHFPLICKLRRAIISFMSKRVLVTDPHLMKHALEHGIKKSRLDWTCFGIPPKIVLDERNRKLKKQIVDFKKSFHKNGIPHVAVGLCVSERAKKKVHYLHADSIVGKCKEREDACVILIMIGKYPAGKEFRKAKQRVSSSPFILYIDESFPVNEPYIAEHVDFFYRDMTDYSIAYTLYVACNVRKPVFTHNFGALPGIIENENIGFTLNGSLHNQSKIVSLLESWSSEGSKRFLEKRNWKTGAERLLNNIHKTGI